MEELMREDEGLKPGSPIVTDDKKKKPATDNTVPSYKKGGTVKKTGMAMVHKGEKVIPQKKVESMNQFMSRRNKETMKKRSY
jgi:hypothetical protein